MFSACFFLNVWWIELLLHYDLQLQKMYQILWLLKLQRQAIPTSTMGEYCFRHWILKLQCIHLDVSTVCKKANSRRNNVFDMKELDWNGHAIAYTTSCELNGTEFREKKSIFPDNCWFTVVYIVITLTTKYLGKPELSEPWHFCNRYIVGTWRLSPLRAWNISSPTHFPPSHSLFSYPFPSAPLSALSFPPLPLLCTRQSFSLLHSFIPFLSIPSRSLPLPFPFSGDPGYHPRTLFECTCSWVCLRLFLVG